MKLISQSEKQEELENYVLESKNYERAFKLASLHREFLKQPLTLGMFVPCDEDGNVIIEIEDSGIGIEGLEIVGHNQEYQQAKERVLFDSKIRHNKELNNFYLQKKYHPYYENLKISPEYTIEDLIHYNLTLTQSAQKQIGL